MNLNIELHNYREWINPDGTQCEIIADITNDTLDVANSYGDKHLCFLENEVDIPATKQPTRIPINIPLTRGVFTVAKITRIKRNYVVSGGAGKFATVDDLTPFLTAGQIAEITQAVKYAVKTYKENLPDKPDATLERIAEKRARIAARVAEASEMTLDKIAPIAEAV